MSRFLVISCSLNPDSNSRRLCKEVFEQIRQTHDVEWIDLVDLNLPMCDGDHAYLHPSVAPLAEKIRNAKCVILGIPVYNYAASASVKNMIELTGGAWLDKIVGFVCAAGGKMSYMSVMGLANSLMLDFRCLIIPRFVYAYGESFDATGAHVPEIQTRIEELSHAAARLTTAVSD